MMVEELQQVFPEKQAAGRRARKTMQKKKNWKTSLKTNENSQVKIRKKYTQKHK